MILLLLASACISLVMRQFDDAISITCVCFLLLLLLNAHPTLASNSLLRQL